MARIRTIKPEIFQHDGLADLSPLHRLLFIGLFTQADRDGRIEDRPARLKVCLMPYDPIDMDRALQELAGHTDRFITRYEAAGKRVIEIRNFLRHQIPGRDEPPSSLPAPDGTYSDFIPAPNDTVRQRVYQRDDNRCAYCNLYVAGANSRQRCIDHVIPLSRGGTNAFDNLVTCCKKCNQRKGTHLPGEVGFDWPNSIPVNDTVNPPLIRKGKERKGRERKGRERKGLGDSAPARTKTKTASRRQYRKPDDVHLTAEARAFATEAGIEPGVVDAEWARFSDHEFKRAISDWAAAWRNWCRNAVEYRQRDGPRGRQPTTAAGRTMQAVREAFNGRDDAGGISDHRQPPKTRPEPSCAVSGGDLDDGRDAKTAEGGRGG